jgi:hypothetical protein
VAGGIRHVNGCGARTHEGGHHKPHLQCCEFLRRQPPLDPHTDGCEPGVARGGGDRRAAASAQPSRSSSADRGGGSCAPAGLAPIGAVTVSSTAPVVVGGRRTRCRDRTYRTAHHLGHRDGCRCRRVTQVNGQSFGQQPGRGPNHSGCPTQGQMYPVGVDPRRDIANSFLSRRLSVPERVCTGRVCSPAPSHRATIEATSPHQPPAPHFPK